MRPEEAAVIGQWLSQAEDISPVVELGSSTIHFRKVEKPHIDVLVHAPLRERGLQIVHTDLKAGDGIDISGNIYDWGVRAQLKKISARSVLCCNIFEHVIDRKGFAVICDDILAPGGKMIVSVPYSYPYHLDPIDTYYRPSPTEIGNLFPGYSILKAEIVKSGSHWSDLNRLIDIPRDVVRSLLMRGGLEASKARFHRLFWLFRSYRVSIVLLQKPIAVET